MSTDRGPIRSALGRALADAGFLNKGNSWRRDNPDVVEVVNLQKSAFGDEYYLNYGLWLKRLGAVKVPAHNKCHVWMRAPRTTLDSASIQRLFDLEAAMPDREAALESYLRTEFLPVAASCGSLAGLRRMYRDGFLKSAMVTGEARAVLQADS